MTTRYAYRYLDVDAPGAIVLAGSLDAALAAAARDHAVEVLEDDGTGGWREVTVPYGPSALAGAAAPPSEKSDPVGVVYDSMWTSGDGVDFYYRHHALGTARGPAQWSSEHDCNRVCGHHLAAKCLSCSVCLDCDGCYCGEDEW